MGRESKARRRRKAEAQALESYYAERAQTRPAHTHLVRDIQVQAEQFSGPIPSPEHLAGYGEIDPAFPVRIIDAWEKESAHRRSLELAAVQAEIDGASELRRITKRGQLFGFSLGIGAIAGGVLIVWLSEGQAGEVAGAVISGAGLVSLVWGPRGNPSAVRVESPPDQAADG